MSRSVCSPLSCPSPSLVGAATRSLKQGRRLLFETLEIRATPTVGIMRDNMIAEILEQAPQVVS
ncbi:hypothetical protein ETAA8_70850 [Anatilimnocola aggregata]|uniref:Uncharacterized protein n=1 Tax=Anatilimnocola aggregata TaxID=2528021 RepID=A0A517YNY3_9BACT|nr:hypothetical protein [Anatilimnocola aggregata]QDU31923.1 hypothetical protein ETAA8_70850 [Anatilimnocola aggregata]